MSADDDTKPGERQLLHLLDNFHETLSLVVEGNE